jgi:hypothetical protein
MNKSLGNALAGSMTLAAILAIGITAVWIFLIFSLAVATQRDSFFHALDHEFEYGLIMAVLLPSPAMAAIQLLFLTPLSPARAHGLFHFGTTVRYAALAYAVPLLLTILLSAVLALLCLRRHRRYSEEGLVAWTSFVFVMGLPGLIGYLLHRRWPATEHCANCRKNSPRDRDACLHCGTPCPTPAPKGIEIFA